MALSLTALTQPTNKIQSVTATILLVGMAGTVGTALGFQHLAGFLPCKLCLEQRTPYYIGAPLILIGLIASRLKWPAILTRGLLLIGALLMTYGFVLAIFHAGVELKYWAGPTDCSAAAMAITKKAGSLLSDLNAIKPAACDEAVGYFLGLSFPGWNAVASALFAAIGFYGAFATGKRRI